MKNAKSWSLAVSILLIGMIILFIIGFFPKSIDAHAETNYYSAEQYTENDRLLQPDGTRSNRNIRHFANDVKQSGINRSRRGWRRSSFQAGRPSAPMRSGFRASWNLCSITRTCSFPTWHSPACPCWSASPMWAGWTGGTASPTPSR